MPLRSELSPDSSFLKLSVFESHSATASRCWSEWTSGSGTANESEIQTRKMFGSLLRSAMRCTSCSASAFDCETATGCAKVFVSASYSLSAFG